MESITWGALFFEPLEHLLAEWGIDPHAGIDALVVSDEVLRIAGGPADEPADDRGGAEAHDLLQVLFDAADEGVVVELQQVFLQGTAQKDTQQDGAVRRPVVELVGDPAASEEVAQAAAGDEEAEASERMADVGAAVAERQRRHRRVA